jgi:D-glycero-alpha-D-manno-heptose 1-phosphate guanylyltransferase
MSDTHEKSSDSPNSPFMGQPRIREAIILAGGLGTRLRAAVPDLPKCLAPVAGRPFIVHITDYFREQGIEKFIFALGYKSGYFDDFFRSAFSSSDYRVSVEKEPLGTGGAIQLACRLAEDKNVLVLNGDTFFQIRLDELSVFHEKAQADCSLCLRPMQNFDRFGVVELGPDRRILRFREKQGYAEGLINGGVYALNRERFLAERWPDKFSFEKNYLEKYTSSRRLFGLIQDGYFIDMGTPEDYENANKHEWQPGKGANP